MPVSASLRAKLKKLAPPLRQGFLRFKPFRDAELKKYRSRTGHKPRSFEDYASIAKKAGAAYRKHRGKFPGRKMGDSECEEYYPRSCKVYKRAGGCKTYKRRKCKKLA